MKRLYIADLHIHSHYSRATSRDCTPELLEYTAWRKGIQILGSGDFTHPAWRQELKEKLIQKEEGLYCLKEEFQIKTSGRWGRKRPRFVISGEISSIYKKNGRVHKVHSLILLPDLKSAERLSFKLEEIGNLHSDGRPILGLDCRDLVEITLSVCPEAIYIPAHIWTPHFSLFGAFSGFDTIKECYEDMSPYIRALETGLSSDPAMNWQLSALDNYFLISNSDAHSPAKLGREANLLETELSYPALKDALQNGKGLAGTIEFFPEEGKYHLDGHRNCGVCFSPEETEQFSGKCPVCGRKLTIGVAHRIRQLADQPLGRVPKQVQPFESLVPLQEVIASCLNVPSGSTKATRIYEQMLEQLGTEFDILRKLPEEELKRGADARITEGIRRLRAGQVLREPGFDGAYGSIRLFSLEELKAFEGQLNLDLGELQKPKARQAKEIVSSVWAESGANENITTEQRKAAVPLKGLEKAEVLPKEKISKQDAVRSQQNKEQLNEAQQKAAGFCGRAAAVIAGPGTGKTKTLIGHVEFLLKERNVLPEQITVVTFTNQAAAECKARIIASVGESVGKQIHTGTFHSICFGILTEQGREFHLMQEAECLELAEQIVAGTKTSMLEKSLRQKRDPTARALLEQVSKKKMGLPFREGEQLNERIRQYQEALTTKNALDFDDLLLEVLKLYKTEEHEGTAGLQKPFTHLLVDEFQDINQVQYQLLKVWNKNGRELFVIGDPAQAIYGFRGAVAGCFEQMKQEFSDLEVMELKKNYRSTPQILSASESVLTAGGVFRRSLIPIVPPGFPVRIIKTESGIEEGIFIAKQINRLVGGIDMLDSQEQEGTVSDGERSAKSFGDIVVLYRTRRQGKLLEYCFQKEGIPYVVSGREEFLMEQEIRGTVDFFSSLYEPGDEWLRTNCQRLLFGTGEEAKEKYLAAVQQWKPVIRESPPGKVLEAWTRERTWKKEALLQKLINMAGCYETMQEFLNVLIFGVESDLKRSGGKRYLSDAVHFMTLHGSKGLEFPIVFLCGVNQGLVPLLNGHSADKEEERRLFYVGMTRAKEELVLISSGEPSEFLVTMQKAKSQVLESSVSEIAAAQMNWIKEEEPPKKRKRKEKEEDSGIQLSLFDFFG